MRVSTYQEKGILPGKTEMEDRIVAGHNILSDGYHCLENTGNGIYAVCDGVGGQAGSSFASFTVSCSLAGLSVPIPQKELMNSLRAVHQRLIESGTTATTLTAININDCSMYMVHIGNCRLYRLTDGYLCQISTDQTRVEDLRRLGVAEEEIPKAERTIINACLGVRSELIEKMVSADITKEIRHSTRMLLTSDGIHDHVTIDELELFMKKEITKDSLKNLADLSRAKGSADDISIMVIER